MDGGFVKQIIDFFIKFGVYDSLIVVVLFALIWVGYRFVNYWLAQQENKAMAEVRTINNKLIGDLETKSDELATIKQSIVGHEHHYNQDSKPIYLDDESRVKELMDHSFFLKLDYWIKYKIPDFKISNLQKQYVFQDYAKIRYSKVLEFWKNFVISRDYVSLKSNALKTKMTMGFLDIRDKTSEEIKKFKIPPIIEDKIENERILIDKYIVSYIDEVCDSSLYQDNISKLHAFFDFKEVLFEIEINDLLNKAENMNGELNGLDYR